MSKSLNVSPACGLLAKCRVRVNSGRKILLKWATRLDFIYTALTNEQPRVRVADRRQQQTMAAGVYIENRLDLD